jgi:hypothetical protein
VTIHEDNPHRKIITKPVREAKARLWAVAPLMMMTIHEGFCVLGEIARCIIDGAAVLLSYGTIMKA